MANNKKSFVLYTDLIYTVAQLTNSKAGVLFKHILSYVNDEKPETNDLIIKISFEPIKQSLKRDLEKWDNGSEKRAEKARLAGLASAKSRELKATKTNLVVENELGSTKSTVSVSVSGNVSVSDNGSVNDINKRKVQFRKLLSPFLNIHNEDFLKNFYEYWSEHNVNGKKMRFEYSKNQPFNINRRLTTWFNRQQDFKKEKSYAKKEKKSAYDIIQEVKQGTYEQ